jgi:hypothetical protein
MKYSISYLLLGLNLMSPLFSSSGAWAQDDKYQYKLLKDFRREITLPSTDLHERKKIIDIVRSTYQELFIHKENKLTAFGKNASPLPALNRLEEKMGSMSEKEFFYELVQSYLPLNDWHTTIKLPKPHSCFRSSLPVKFKRVGHSNGKTVMAVSEFASKEFLETLSEPLTIERGDILLRYDGASPETVLTKIKASISAANPEALDRMAALHLTWSSQATSPAPKSDHVTLSLQNSQGAIYQVTLPWITRRDSDCLKSSTFDNRGFTILDEVHEVYDLKSYPHQKSRSTEEEFYITTDEPTLKYQLLKNENGTFGIIKLESFLPKKLSFEKTVEEIKWIVSKKFKKTDGLIFDIRDNGGGYIELADTLVQIFASKKISPMNFRLKASPMNLHYWSKTAPQSLFGQLLERTQTRNVSYVEAPLYPNGVSVQFKQIYFKPVAVFTSALCYSSCDMFSAQVQDQSTFLIFGEDSTTGAGGANNVNLSFLYNNLPSKDKGPFEVLPANMDIGFSYRQSVRTGKSSGHLIENIGVRSDVIVPPTLQDLRTHSSEQYRIITRKLVKKIN